MEELVEELSVNTQGRRWILTINNPAQTDEQMIDYIQNLEHFKYSIFQREKGHEKETEHFQLFIIFTISKRFSTIKNYFPTAHIEQAKGTNVQCRDYCSKSDTRVSGPFEIGQFAEERARTDKQAFLQLARAGVKEKEISDLYPSLYLDNFKDIPAIFRRSLREQFKNKSRDVEVTYIYGPPGTGKTSYIFNHFEPDEFYRVTLYNNSAFDDYMNEDILVLDEFNSSFKITDMNHFLDRYYIPLPARYDNRFAVYTKVFIISNLPLSKQYIDEQERKPDLYKAFLRRIDNVYRLDSFGGPIIIEKKKAVGVQQEFELEELSKEESEGLPW